MKSSHKSPIPTPISPFVLFLILLMACSSEDGSMSPDPCKAITCENGGTCVNGNCECLNGFSGDNCENTVPLFTETVLITGLEYPHGIEIDSQGDLWVTTAGTANNDGKIQVITSDSELFDFITNLPSSQREGVPVSAHDLMIDGDNLWVALGVETNATLGGKLLKIDISDYQPGNTPLLYDESMAVANVTAYVGGESNIHGLALGPDGNVYIADAGANSILVFNVNENELSTLTEFSDVNIEAVPTEIIYKSDPGTFLVTLFRGSPFLTGQSVIYEVLRNGSILHGMDGFTGAIDLAESSNGNILCLEYASFSDGFSNNTGKILEKEGKNIIELYTGLSFPTSFVSDGNEGYYITSRNQNGSIIHLQPA